MSPETQASAHCKRQYIVAGREVQVTCGDIHE